MFFLSLSERTKLASFVKKKSKNRVPVIASGHISGNFEDQVRELNAVAETGVDAVVLITNRLAEVDESDDLWQKNLEKLLKQIPECVALGFYECHHPYKRLISSELLKFCADTGRFFFLKDTSCNSNNIKAKLEAIKDTGLKIFNANIATLLETLKFGISGYRGVMANFHPDLYSWLLTNWQSRKEEARYLFNFLSLSSQIERQLYPVNAKYFLTLEGIMKNYYSRSKNHKDLTSTNRLEIE